MACSTVVWKVIWLRNFLYSLDLIREDHPIPMNVNSKSAMSMVTELEFSNRSKLIEVKYHFIREKKRKKK